MRAANRVVQVFGRSPVVLSIIHPVSRDEALESLRVVTAAGAPGAFLVDEGTDEAGVLALVREARERHPQLWIGVNLLSRRPASALAVALRALDGRLDGLWSDYSGVDERADPQSRAGELLATRQILRWPGLYFGGVAFKYQREVPRAGLLSTALRATRYADVVCTSGLGTGRADDLDKVRLMRAGVGGSALALASHGVTVEHARDYASHGVTVEHARDYATHVDALLVGTSIERDGVVDEGRLAALLGALA
jgi:uncharacterized protein